MNYCSRLRIFEELLEEWEGTGKQEQKHPTVVKFLFRFFLYLSIAQIQIQFFFLNLGCRLLCFYQNTWMKLCLQANSFYEIKNIAGPQYYKKQIEEKNFKKCVIT